jgi:hypothetical protein
MTFFIAGIPIRFLNAKILLQNLPYYWTKVLLQESTDLHPFMSQIMAIMATISPDQLIALVVNSSLLAKMRRVAKMIALWKHNYAKKCVDYLLKSPRFYNKPLIIGFAAFLQLCHIRRIQREELTADQICIIEELKISLSQSIFDDDVLTELNNRQQYRQGVMFPGDTVDYLEQFGWFIFAKHFMDEGEFDSIEFKIAG